jgi:3',5'-cyclic-AMP phosphodiesterase
MSTLLQHGLPGAFPIAMMLLQTGCLLSSPYDTSLSDDESNLTAKNIRKLAAVDRPPVSAGEPLSFAFVSDTHDGYNEFDRITAAINARKDVELTLHGGDVTDLGMKIEYLWAHESLSSLRAPFFVAPGNHDGLANGRILYSKMFGPTNFELTYAGIHFVVINTNTLEWNMAEPDLAWIERAVNSPGHSATIVLSHQPPHSKPHLSDDVGDRLTEILERAGVSLYLYGHYHDSVVLQSKGSTIYAKGEAGLYGSWMVVHTDGSSYSFELCKFDKCAPARAAEPAPVGALE